MRAWRGCVAGVIAAIAAHGSAAAADLGAVNVIEGSVPAYVDVRLTNEVVIDLSSRATHRVDGSGRFVGAVLARRSPAGLENAAVAVVGRFDQPTLCPGGCDHVITTAAGQLERDPNAPVSAWDPTKIPLPPGEYRLALVTDGTPARVEVHLPGLDGERAFRPTAPLQPLQLEPPQREDPLGTGPAAVFSGGGMLSSPGVLAISAVAEGGDSGEVDFEACTYQDEAPAMAFWPGCSQRTEHAVFFGHTYAAADQTFATHWVFRLPGGTFSTGGNFFAAAPIRSAGWGAAFIPLGGPPAPVGTDPAATGTDPPAPVGTDPAAVGTDPGRVTLASRRVRRAGRRALVTLRCSGGPCRGTLTFLGGRTVRFRIPAGASRTIRVPLGRKPVLDLAAAGAEPRTLRVRLTRAR